MPANLRIKLFGNFEAWLNDEAIPPKAWPQRKTQMLLKILVSQRGQVFTQDQLIDMLFADQALDAAKRNLTKRLSELRNILEPDRKRGQDSQFITRIGEGYCLDADAPCWVDVEAFDTALKTAQRHQDDGDWTQALAAYRQADDLYRGELLSEDRYEEWTIQSRDHWHERHLSALEHLADCHARLGQFNRAIEQAERALQLDPNRERPYRQLMTYYWREGEQSKVQQTYQKCVEVFDDLGVEASTETHTLYQNIQDGNVADLEAAYPQIDSTPAPQPSTSKSESTSTPQTPRLKSSNNLPRQLTSFIGRDSDLEEVKQRLPQVGLLTLTGIGGTGKTRLAIKAASELLENYPDGVWFIDLAPLSDSSLVTQTVAGKMGIAETSGMPLEQTLVEVLQSKQTLLIFDNCEHVLSAAARLAEALLHQCPNLSILATSREPLNIVGEYTWPVMPLSVANPDTDNLLEELEHCEAAQLFLDRIRAIRPQFELTEENAFAVMTVCQQLDGIPLALEFAAARVRALPVTKLAERLEDRFRLLTAGSRTALPRQQTLRATLDWSYELLSIPEKKLLNRLSIFSGGWSLEAAEAICGEEEEDVFELLSALVQKSLVEVDEQRADVRYRMLETVKQYGAERLISDREVDVYREKHARYFFSLVEAAAPELVGANQTEWLNKLELEHSNIHVALDWCWSNAQAEMLMAFCANMGQFCEIHGHYTTGRRWLDRALAYKDQAPKEILANALRWAGTLADDQGDYGVAVEFLKEGQRLYQDLEDKNGEAIVLRMLGQVLRNQGQLDESREMFETGLTIQTNLDNLNEMGVLHRNLGNVAFDQGRDDIAKPHYEKSLELHRLTGDKVGISHALNNLGILMFQEQNFDGAKDLYEECIAIYEELGSENSVAVTLNNLGIVYFRKEEYDKAREVYQRSVAINRSLGEKITLNRTLYNLGNVELFDDNIKAAIDYFKQSINVCLEIKNSQFIAYNLAALSNLHHQHNRHQIAMQLHGKVKALLDETGATISPFEQARVDEVAEAMKQNFGEAAYQKEFDIGYQLSTDEAIKLALEAYQ